MQKSFHTCNIQVAWDLPVCKRVNCSRWLWKADENWLLCLQCRS